MAAAGSSWEAASANTGASFVSANAGLVSSVLTCASDSSLASGVAADSSAGSSAVSSPDAGAGAS